jgi:hypothetical protein
VRAYHSKYLIQCEWVVPSIIPLLLSYQNRPDPPGYKIKHTICNMAHTNRMCSCEITSIRPCLQTFLFVPSETTNVVVEHFSYVGRSCCRIMRSSPFFWTKQNNFDSLWSNQYNQNRNLYKVITEILLATNFGTQIKEHSESCIYLESTQ